LLRDILKKYGNDYKETFAPTLKQDNIRIITVIAVNMNIKIKQIDINNSQVKKPVALIIQKGKIYF